MSEYTHEQLLNEMRTLTHFAKEARTAILVAYSYSTSPPMGDRAKTICDQITTVVKRIEAGIPPRVLTEADKRQAHEKIIAAFDQRDSRERIAELEAAVMDLFVLMPPDRVRLIKLATTGLIAAIQGDT